MESDLRCGEEEEKSGPTLCNIYLTNINNNDQKIGDRTARRGSGLGNSSEHLECVKMVDSLHLIFLLNYFLLISATLKFKMFPLATAELVELLSGVRTARGGRECHLCFALQ